MTDVQETPTPAAAPVRVRKTYALRDLDVAPENMRFGAPPDEEIAQLAATIKAAGLLQPLTVRPGRRKEKAAMALDGRRRLLALGLLLAEGAVGEDYLVDVFEETDPGRQAAAVLLTNTAVPVHIADVITSIGKMLKARLTPDVIAAALGYGEIEVRRLAALSGLHPKALEALRLGRLTLRQARLLARLPDRKEQAQISEAAIQGYGFPEHRIGEALDRGRLTVRDRRFGLVGAARYLAGGGRIETDLFGERPDVLLDADVLESLWMARAAALAAPSEARGLAVHVTSSLTPDWPEGLDGFGYGHGVGLDPQQLEAWRAARLAAQAAGADLAAGDVADAAADDALRSYVAACIASDQAAEPDRPVTTVVLTPGFGAGLEVHCFGPAAPEPEADGGSDEDAVEPVAAARQTDVAALPVAVAAVPEIEGVNHALHEVRTDAATRALIRALADDPGTALVALIARLFDVLVLRAGRGRGDGASTLTAEAYGRPRTRVIEALDGEVRARLADRRSAWQVSGRSAIGWIAELAHGDKMALLAELTALSLDLREERTSAVRRSARAEAAELAALCGADVTLHWTPDEVFLRAHSKAQLLAMLEAMAAEDDRARTLKKEELVGFVAERAAERGWAPAYLSWSAAVPETDPPGEAEAADAEETVAAPLAA